MMMFCTVVIQDTDEVVKTLSLDQSNGSNVQFTQSVAAYKNAWKSKSETFLLLCDNKGHITYPMMNMHNIVSFLILIITALSAPLCCIRHSVVIDIGLTNGESN